MCPIGGVLTIDGDGEALWLLDGLLQEPTVDHSYTFDMLYDAASQRLIAGTCGRGVYYMPLDGIDFDALVPDTDPQDNW